MTVFAGMPQKKGRKDKRQSPFDLIPKGFHSLVKF